MEHEFLLRHSVRKNKTTFSDYSLPPEIFHWNDSTSRVPFTFQPNFRETFCNWLTTLGRVPFNQNVQCEFWATSSSEWNSIFQIFQNRGRPCDKYPNFWKIFPGSFLSIQLSSRNFRLNCLHFENSPVSGISVNVSEKFLYHLPLFRKFWLNGKRSMLPTLILDLLKLSSIYTSNYLWPIAKRAEIQLDPSDIKSNTLVWSKH